MSLKAQIEAILFVTAKPIKAQAIARIVNSDVQQVRQALLELVHDYEERQGGLEIADDDGYSFQIKDKYAALMDEFMPVEMSAALIRTLSAIAIKQPILQSDIIRVRGAGAYEHIRELVAKDLVAKKEESGERSPQLTTTKKFQEYFRLTKDGKDLRNYLKKAVKKANAAEAALGQLNIESILPVEVEEQLNTGIYLETADMAAADFDPSDVLVNALVPEALQPVPIDGFDHQSAEPFPAPPAQPVTAELSAVESKTVEPVEIVTPPAPTGDSEQSATSTLSRLAQAANTRQPEPLPQQDEPAEDVAGAGVKPEQAPEGTRKSSVQASTASRNEPPMGTAKKPKKAPDKLTELLEKQKLLQRQLKRGVVTGFPDADDQDSPVVGNAAETQVPTTDTGNSI